MTESPQPEEVATTRPALLVPPAIVVNPVHGGPILDGRVRAVIDAVKPAVDAGRFAVKCVASERFAVEAHCFTDGHDVLRVLLNWRADADAGSTGGGAAWHEVPMVALPNDVWQAGFTPPAPGRYRYTVVAWVDALESWRHELKRRVDPDDIRIAARTGALLIDAAAQRAAGTSRADAAALAEWALELDARAVDAEGRLGDVEALRALALDDALTASARKHPDRSFEAVHAVELPLVAERARARFSAWYELFPRSAAAEPGRHGTFRDVEARLPAIAAMGFDVLYFPPIHPIGRVKRKGPNNALVAGDGDAGSPWAIGSREGGHKAIHPELGGTADFAHLLGEAKRFGIEIALDIAFQCAPDHPYVEAHPQWFKWRPDGTVQYAENPPKKYQDIYPFDFENDDWRTLWIELKSVLEHWIGEGVRIFRVDNPHTKAFPFWEWAIGEVKRAHPDTIFLAEAFTRPKVMHRLAKLGFGQSYTYFTWRHTKHELTEYFTELSAGPGRDYFRPNAWPNTPDILNEQLHAAPRSMFMLRFVLAATLSSNYGIYGPAYELLDGTPRSAGSEEYLDSEKYQLRHWDISSASSIAPFIARVNRIRRDNPALHANESLRFIDVDNEQLIAYAKRTESGVPEGENVVVCVVNLDPHHVQSGWLQLDLAWLGVEPDQRTQWHDLLSDQRFTRQGTSLFVQLDPARAPAHVFTLRRHVRTEHDFDYFL